MRTYLIEVCGVFLRMVAETPVLDDLRILYVFGSISRSNNMNSAYTRRNSRTGHVRRCAETPALDDLRILYAFVSFSGLNSINSAYIRRKSKIAYRGVEFFCCRIDVACILALH